MNTGAVLSASSFYSTGARQYPLSYVYAGRYNWGDGDMGASQGAGGSAWSATAYNASQTYFLGMLEATLDTRRIFEGDRTYGLSLRYFYQ